MITFPHAKINLGLFVTGKRPDGFHNLQTLFYPIPYRDILEIIPAAKTELHLSGIPVQGAADDNLCLKAYRLLAHDFQLPPVAIYLHKVIPMGGGLGGGSSDAAHTLLLLNNLFRINIPAMDLLNYAAMLGSDCAFFTQSHAALAEGRGEILKYAHVDLSNYFLLLVLPPVHVSTAEAYAGIVAQEPEEPLERIISRPVDAWKEPLINDFELSIFSRHPLLGDIKLELYRLNAVYAAMSGSGSTLFGLFDNEEDLQQARRAFDGLYKTVGISFSGNNTMWCN